ncbi:MAG TPA: hypothetical protein VG779_02500 [Actinomycetota bacterium]|nr:hypothetical protein [Actinomycetota bacterium]
MVDQDLGANEFTFTGDRTTVTFFPVAPGPLHVGDENGELVYAGIEGDHTFRGKEITRLDSDLGTLLTVVLQANHDAGERDFTLLVPRAFGVTRQQPVTFGTLAIKTTTRGFIATPGVALTYDLLPLVGQAKDVILPL